MNIYIYIYMLIYVNILLYIVIYVRRACAVCKQTVPATAPPLVANRLHALCPLPTCDGMT